MLGKPPPKQVRTCQRRQQTEPVGFDPFRLCEALELRLVPAL